MRRQVTLVTALVLPAFASAMVANAQPQPKPASTAAAPSSTEASASPDPNAAPATSAVTPAPAVSVDMNAKAPDAMTGGTYAVRLRDLEQRVDDLKDQIRRSHTRLALLSDTILGGGTAGSRAEVAYSNEMSGAFLLTRALFVMDGQIQYNRQDESGALADQKEIPVFTGSVPPGDHTIQVSLTFQGNGFGVFSYLRGYKFEVKSSHSFTALEGKMLSVTATSFEKGGATTPLEQRPTVEWNEKIQPLSASSTSAAVSSKNSGGAASGASAGGGPK
jgi:hypothetical protein